MPAPWEKYQAQQTAPSSGPWERYAKPQEPEPKGEPYSGTILPLSRDEQGNVSFDSDAGIVGMVKRAVTLPGDAMTGKVDPTSDEAIGRSADLAAVASPINAVTRSTGAALPGMASKYRKPNVKAPSAEELKRVGSEGYDAVREMGVSYRSDAVRNLATGVKQELEQDGILAELAPKTFKIIRKLGNPPKGSIAPIQGIEAARRALHNARRDFNNPTEQEAARRVVERLDGFIEDPDPASVVAGPAAAAGKTSSEARANYAAAKRSERLQGVEERAELNAAATHSGTNLDNEIRKRARDILTKPKERAGFNKQELNALEKVARGTKNRNLLRFVSKLLGGGGGLGSVVAGGAGWAVGGPVGGIGLPLAGWAGREMSNKAASRAMNSADELVRKRSPLYEQIMRDTPAIPVRPRAAEGAMRSLMLMRPPDA